MVEIYICSIESIKQPIPRHHISSIAMCMKESEKALSSIEEIIKDNILEELTINGETLIIDRSLIEKILGKEIEQNQYIRLVIK
ncbi:MAG: hypothetical protein B6U89_04895 [Desulfurococcales archaeon ex4484_58]|nr:MAG: hypothetical protein B6U89_04895 [Desulfurococcales archaeon ex4484_58]